MLSAVCVEAEYRNVDEVFESIVHREREELVVPCRERDVLALADGTPIWLSLTFASDPQRRFELTGNMLGLDPRGFRFGFDGQPELFRYALSQAPRYVDLRARRVATRLSVVCRTPDKRFDAVTSDLSRSGALLKMPPVLQPGTPLSVLLVTPPMQPVHLQAEVVRQVETGLAVQFQPAPVLDEYLARLY
jgi:hypothetical protein